MNYTIPPSNQIRKKVFLNIKRILIWSKSFKEDISDKLGFWANGYIQKNVKIVKGGDR